MSFMLALGMAFANAWSNRALAKLESLLGQAMGTFCPCRRSCQHSLRTPTTFSMVRSVQKYDYQLSHRDCPAKTRHRTCGRPTLNPVWQRQRRCRSGLDHMCNKGQPPPPPPPRQPPFWVRNVVGDVLRRHIASQIYLWVEGERSGALRFSAFSPSSTAPSANHAQFRSIYMIAAST